MARTRPLPQTKTLGTPWNLRPATERVPARAVRVGDVVLEGPDHPAIVTQSFKNRLGWVLRARYVWQQPYEAPWALGTFHPDHKLDRALPGEY